MATDSLHLMTLDELRHERVLARIVVLETKVNFRDKSTSERRVLERTLEEGREYIRILDARIARLERQNRPQQ